MTYDESQEYIHTTCTAGSVYDLECIKTLLKILDNPEKHLKIIHISGTNGKGSVSRMIMHILKEAGYSVGIFNSPFLQKRNEYLCINGRDASDSEYALIAGIVKNAVEKNLTSVHNKGQEECILKRRPTEFEFSFAMAMEYFCRSKCDIAIVECGLGGTNDATNIFTKKELSIITNIGLDHVRLLGTTLKDIAGQKSGIIINNDTVIAYPSDKEAIKVISSSCKKKSAKLIIPEDIPLNISEIALDGEFQKKNAMVALSAIEVLKTKGYHISRNDISKGLINVKWPGRFETLSKNPIVIADGGHNLQCIKALCESLDVKGIKKAIFVIGIMADKDYTAVFNILKEYAVYVIATEPENPRSLDCTEIVKIFNNYGIPGKSVKQPAEAVYSALDLIRTKEYDLPIVITGSLYMMNEIRKPFI